jgi:hypothetical protein
MGALLSSVFNIADKDTIVKVERWWCYKVIDLDKKLAGQNKLTGPDSASRNQWA